MFGGLNSVPILMHPAFSPTEPSLYHPVLYVGLQPTVHQSYKAMKFHTDPAMLHVVTKTEESVPETVTVLATKPRILITCSFTEEAANP